MNIPSKPPAPIAVLIVEDEGDLRDSLVEYLTLEGFAVEGVGNLAAATEWLQQSRVDIVVLDLGLLDGDDMQWLAQTPAVKGKGVIITTARGALEERIRGVETGADLYLVKPVPLAELAALAKRLAQRLTTPVVQKPWQLNTLNWTLESPDGKAMRLTHSERVVLGELAAVPGQGVSRADLSVALGHDTTPTDLKRLEILVHRLRTKVKSQLDLVLPLETVHGHGYAFADEIVLVS